MQMKAVIQNYRTGELTVTEMPPPALQPGGVLVKNAVSLVSAGTERLMVELAQKSLLGKARERPELVRQVLEKARRDGILPTFETVRTRLDSPVPLGYSCAGTIIDAGKGVETLQPGDRVACAGAGYASHAEVVFVPENLTARIPDKVDFESASFTTLGAIALQGLRLAEVQLGEIVVVIGLGLVGLLSVQLAKAAGCQALGMDPNPARCRLSEQLGCDITATDGSQFAIQNSQFTAGCGADKVIITADAKNNEPVILAGQVARDRAIVVAVGAVEMEIPRKTYYEKELTFRVSRSYGPGRYDQEYEEKGRDYPIGYIRWTENRNMQAFIQQLADAKMDVKSLITHRFQIEDASKAYDLITGKTPEPFLGIILSYPDQPELSRRIDLRPAIVPSSKKPSVVGRQSSVVVGFLGAGQYATGTLLPAMKKVTGTELKGVCTATGISAQHVARKFGFGFATTDEDEILNDPDINTVVITTRHHLHARQVIAALKAGKHVFCEKPLCVNEKQLKEIATTFNQLNKSNQINQINQTNQIDQIDQINQKNQINQILMVGYNRRFAPMARQLKDFLTHVEEPLVMHYRINAGYIQPNHWVHDPEQGGGRIIGEVCHFVDFLTFLAGALPRRVYVRALPNQGHYRNDNLVITLDFANGSLGTITYVANGNKAFPKERVEVFGGGIAAVLDNFRKLELVRGGGRQVVRAPLRHDKGHRREWEAFVEAVCDNNSSPIIFENIVASALTSFCITNALKSPTPVEVSVKEVFNIT